MFTALNSQYDVVHVNAEFSNQVSDHEPSVVSFTFEKPSVITLASFEVETTDGRAMVKPALS
jgi:hypothetical protein